MSDQRNNPPPPSTPWSPRSLATLVAARQSNNSAMREYAETYTQSRQSLEALEEVVHEHEHQTIRDSVVRLSGAAPDFRPRTITPLSAMVPYDQLPQRHQHQQGTPRPLPYRPSAPTTLSASAPVFQQPNDSTRQLQNQQQHQRSSQSSSLQPGAPVFVPGAVPTLHPCQSAPPPSASFPSTQQQPLWASITSSIQEQRRILNQIFTRVEAWARTYPVLPLARDSSEPVPLADALRPVLSSQTARVEYLSSPPSRTLLLAAMINLRLFEACFRPEQWLRNELWQLMNSLATDMAILIPNHRRTEALSTLSAIISDMHKMARRVRAAPWQWVIVFPKRGSVVTPGMTERNQWVVTIASAALMRVVVFAITPSVTLRWPREKAWEVECVVEASVVGEVKS